MIITLLDNTSNNNIIINFSNFNIVSIDNIDKKIIIAKQILSQSGPITKSILNVNDSISPTITINYYE